MCRGIYQLRNWHHDLGTLVRLTSLLSRAFSESAHKKTSLNNAYLRLTRQKLGSLHNRFNIHADVVRFRRLRSVLLQ